MWIFHKRSSPCPSNHALLQRLKLLEDDLAVLESRIERIRGRLNGVRRAGGTGDTDPPELTKAEILRRWRAGEPLTERQA